MNPFKFIWIHLTDLSGQLCYLLYLSQERWDCWIWGKYFQRSNRKVSLNGPTLRNNCVTTISNEKRLWPMINSENFSFSKKLYERKYCFLTRGVTSWHVWNMYKVLCRSIQNVTHKKLDKLKFASSTLSIDTPLIGLGVSVSKIVLLVFWVLMEALHGEKKSDKIGNENNVNTVAVVTFCCWCSLLWLNLEICVIIAIIIIFLSVNHPHLYYLARRFLGMAGWRTKACGWVCNPREKDFAGQDLLLIR